MIEGRVLLALVDAIWQGAVLAGVAALTLRVAKTNAATRYVVWTAVALAVALLPFADFALSRVPTARSIPVSSAGGGVSAASTTRSAPSVRPVRGAASSVSSGASAHARPSAHQRPASIMVVHASRLWLQLLLLALGLVSIARLGLLIRSYYRLRAMVARATPLARPVPSNAVGCLRVMSTRDLPVPAAIGLGRPAVLLPEHLLVDLDDEELDHIVLHEAAHLARHDDWSNLFQRLVSAVLFFHPVVAFVGKRLDLERELACDDWVIAMTGARHPYAFCLTKLAELAGRAKHVSPALGLVASRAALRARIDHLLDTTANALPGRTRLAAIVAGAIGILTLGISAMRLPVIAAPLDAATSRDPQIAAKIVVIATPASVTIVATPAASSTLDASERGQATASSTVVIVRAAPTPAPHATPIAVRFEVRPVPAARPAIVRARLAVDNDASMHALIASALDRAHAALTNSQLATHVEIVGDESRSLASDESAPPISSPSPTPSPRLVRTLRIIVPSTIVINSSTSFARTVARGETITDLRTARERLRLCVACTVRGVDLRSLDLRDAMLSNVTFDDVDLRGVDLSEASLKGAAFSNTKLAGARFVGAQLGGANLVNCACSGVDFSAAQLGGANFVGADLSRTRFRKAHVEGANFAAADLRNSMFVDAIAPGANFAGAKLAGSDMTAAVLIGAALTGIDFGSVVLTDANLTGARISGAR